MDQNLIESFRRIGEAISTIWKGSKLKIAGFWRHYQRQYANGLVWSEDPRRARAIIFLRTKNRRIKRKQWKHIHSKGGLF